MSQEEPSYWSNAFKPWFGWYKETDYRSGSIKREHYMDDIDDHDFPLENSNMQYKMGSRIYKEPFGMIYPRECAKFVGKYFDCRKEYGIYSIVDDAPPQCNGKKAAIFEECPHWVIENMAAKRKFYKRAEHIDRLTYQRAMEVSDFNK